MAEMPLRTPGIVWMELSQLSSSPVQEKMQHKQWPWSVCSWSVRGHQGGSLLAQDSPGHGQDTGMSLQPPLGLTQATKLPGH